MGNSEKLRKDKYYESHTLFSKGLFACKISRPELNPTVSALCRRVKNQNDDDWEKLLRFIQYTNGTRRYRLIFSADDLNVIKWYVAYAFAIRADL